MAEGIDTQQVLAELVPVWLADLAGEERAEGRRLLEALVADWAVEADRTPDPQAVLRFQRADVDAAGRDRDPTARLGALRAHVTGRRAERLGARTFALGRAILDGAIEDPAAREEGAKLLREAEALAVDVRALPEGPATDPVRRELGDAVMEALFAVERTGMSIRLARVAGGGGGPTTTP